MIPYHTCNYRTNRTLPFQAIPASIQSLDSSNNFFICCCRFNSPSFVIQILDTNTGEYTFTAERIQELLNRVDARHFVLGVSQMDFGEVEHDNGILHTAMRNGNSVKLLVE